MARVDFEAAWSDLQELVASKTHHSERDLLRAMAEIQARHRVPESLIDRAVRIHGLPMLTRLASAAMSNDPEATPSGDVDSVDAAAVDDPRPPKSEGGHDGSNHQGSSQHRTPLAA